MRHENDTFRPIASPAVLAQVSSRRRCASALRAWSVITLLAVSVVGCGGGGSSPGDDESFIHWQGNSNDTVVLAAGDEQVQFESTSGDMFYKSTTFTNVAVSGSSLYVGGVLVGSVVIRPGTNNSNVAVMVCQNSADVTLVPNGSSITVTCALGAGGSGGTGGNGGGGGGINPVTLACNGANGNGVNGLSLYNPSNFIAYTLSDLIANAAVNSTLNWGVKYQNPGLAVGSYSGSLRARLWAVSSPYSGGTITGRVLGLFTPNFTGSGARSATQVFVGGFSTTSVQSSAQQQNPSAGSYCLVATLEEFSRSCTSSDGFCMDDWIQFPAPVGFR
jgi:hypothetical protein